MCFFSPKIRKLDFWGKVCKGCTKILYKDIFLEDMIQIKKWFAKQDKASLFQIPTKKAVQQLLIAPDQKPQQLKVY